MKSTSLASLILSGLHSSAKPDTKQWYTNYVKGSKWIGNKAPSVRKVVRDTVHATVNNNYHYDDVIDNSIHLIQQEECDAKLAGMILLSEFCPIEKLATAHVLNRLVDQVLEPQIYIADWATADGFSGHVLRRIAYRDNELAKTITNFSKDGTTLWYRRCGIVPFVAYFKHRDKLPPNFGTIIIDAVEHCLNASPQERFTQTGCAWLLRYAILQKEDREYALKVITKHSLVWNLEAKKSISEKLAPNDPLRKQIMSLGKNKP